MFYALFFAGVFCLSIATAIGGKPDLQKPLGPIGPIHKDLHGPHQDFDLYLPAKAGKPHYGLVVYLHAGGFTAGDKSEDQKTLEWLASQGYVAAGINYTL